MTDGEGALIIDRSVQEVRAAPAGQDLDRPAGDVVADEAAAAVAKQHVHSFFGLPFPCPIYRCNSGYDDRCKVAAILFLLWEAQWARNCT